MYQLKALSCLAGRLKKHIQLCSLYCNLLLMLSEDERRQFFDQAPDDVYSIQVCQMTSILIYWLIQTDGVKLLL